MTDPREWTLDHLTSGTWDVLVVGAGIIGSRVAYDAARLGLRVVLVDAGDFGGATSSASSKLIHGGLRYMATGQLGLVRAAQRERHLLLKRLAPHLVRPMPMVLVEPGGYPWPLFAAGLVGYRAVAGRGAGRPRFISAKRARTLVPGVDFTPFPHLTELPEAQTNDSRLTLATVKAAARAGATVVNHIEVVALDRRGTRLVGAVLQDHQSSRFLPLRCRAVVNASGPWVDRVRVLEDAHARPCSRLSKGVNALLPLPVGWQGAVAYSGDPARGATFAVPWEGSLLLGVTDHEFMGDPADVAPTDADVAELVASAEAFLPARMLRGAHRARAIAGLRVLPSRNGTTARLSRDHLLSVGPAGMVSVAGGKLTTHRLIALDALRHLPVDIRPRRLRLSDAPLPGAGLTVVPDCLIEDPEVSDHLLHHYGSEVSSLVRYADVDDRALDRIHPAGPDVWAQAYFAFDSEWALTTDDVVRRRTTLEARGLVTHSIRRQIEALAARPATVTPFAA